MKIEDYRFGEILIDGKTYTQDVKITDKVIPNWWRKEGHLLQLEDIKDIIDYKPEVLVIGNGAYSVMEVREDLIKLLKDKGIECIVLPTKVACEKFNQLINEGRKVAGCFHLTC